ncbi:GEVED domain-containing protein [Chryseobacterium sp.]|uniref:GEVED domain-containing protein n=1 Tax=Chryseobacterium sp. TaxID=1871047 RepID=UPI0011CAB466|nr:GEVED domain-containing protein [Chryseobacterium sp.]TXF74985.1 T9SS type A sorting domain-containing protein [Chryseobacterium sp.]
MKKFFTLLILLCSFVTSFAQWTPTSMQGEKIRNNTKASDYFKLDLNVLRAQLVNVQETGPKAKPVQVSIPTLGGKIETFAVYSLPVVVKELADQYQLGSYVGVDVSDPSKYIRFSVAPNDFQAMIIHNGEYQFIEPANKSKTVYEVHPKTVDTGNKGFLCSMNEDILSKEEINKLYDAGKSFTNNPNDFSKSSDKKYRTMRLAISVTAEYTTFFGGVAGALTAINATMTRVNGVFEKDFALHLNVQNFPNLIYTNAATDPYSSGPVGSGGPWNTELQNTLTTVIGNSAYDIGHLFGASGGGGNAGCIGCVCVDDTPSLTDKNKGSGFTSPADNIPQGDNFDIDYVAHEMGHQLGANHTFSHNTENSGMNVEPGSGSTIMGYAGITGTNTDVQPHSDGYFHTVSINQVQTNLTNKTCDVEIPVTNNPPVIAALPTYNIPKGTAFVLTGSVTDPENDPMTFTWEEVDTAGAVVINKTNLGTTSSGASFRSVVPSTGGATRYFPKLQSVLAGVLNNSTNTWEAVSTVARTTNFALTVRDNNPAGNQQQTQRANQVIVVGSAGPFKVTSTAGYNNNPSAVTWDVVGTTAAPYSVANVKIDYTTDNGATWNVLSASTPNDGTESFTFTGVATGAIAKVRVTALNNVFYAIGNVTISAMAVCDPTIAPTGITVSPVTQTQATVNWTAAAGAAYVLQYRKIGAPTWTTATPAPTTNSYIITGLTESTQYEVQVAYVCSSTQGVFSTSTNFTTLSLSYCPISSTNFSDEYIGGVKVTPNGAAVMNSTSAGSTYTDYTTDATRLVNLVIGSANNNIEVTKVWTGTTFSEAVVVWIDFNRNGVFETAEKVMDSPASTTNPVSTNFTVPPTAYSGGLPTRMRVILKFSSPPTDACTGYTYGEIEDYAVKLITPIPCTSAAPLNGSVTNVTATTANVTWDSATGATYVLQYRAVGSATWITATPAPTSSSYTLTNLTPSTPYEVQVAYVCGTTQGTFTAPIVFTTPAVVYCPQTSSDTTRGYISNVMVSPTGANVMTNTTGAANYTLFTAAPAPVNLIIGSTNNAISVSKTWSGTTYASAVAAWIDFNRNGIFEDSEKILTSASSTTTPVTATFTVPATAYSGGLVTRMRVVMQNSTAPVACTNFTYGEVEDYDVKLLQLQPCTTNPPSNITVSSVDATSATISWLNATGATYQLRYRKVGTTAWTTINPATTATVINGLTESTQYEVQIATTCSATTGAFSPSVVFTTSPLTWCPISSTSAGSFINNVTVIPTNSVTMSNNSGASTYTDYYGVPATTITMVRGQANNTLSVGRSIASSTYATSAWVDFNRNGVFETSERIMNLGYSSTTPVTSTFTVPAGAYAGSQPTKMRVIMSFLTITSPCTMSTQGEIEDYPVVFVDMQPCTTAAPSNITVSNITSTTANVSWIATTGGTYVIRYRQVGSPTWITANVPVTPGNSFVIPGLTEQTQYEVQVSTICGGTQGAFSPSVLFTTTPLTYCVPTPTPNSAPSTSADDWIANVTITPTGTPPFAPMTNNSGASGYIDYSSDATKLVNLVMGSTGNTISIGKAWDGTNFSVAVTAWIDFNRNGVFEVGEKIMISPSSTTTPVTATFAVPSPPTAYNGPLKTKMRIMLRESTQPTDACVGYTYGEIEDYAVKLHEPIPCLNTTPVGLTITAITSTSAVATWTADPGGATYSIRYRAVGSTTWITLPLSTNTYTMTPLSSSTQYEVQVAAICSNQMGAYTASSLFTTKCDPTPPAGFTVTNITATSAQVNWAATLGATYSLQYRAVGSGTWITVNVPTNSYNLTALTPYTTYEVQVASICSGATNPYTTPIVFTTLPTCEMAPIGLTVTNLTMTTAEVNWNTFAGATYVLRYRKVGFPNWTTVNLTVNTYLLTGLLENTQYEVQVANVCGGTLQTFTSPYIFTTPSVVYCPMTSASSAAEHISNVKVTPAGGLPAMTNDSGATNYSSYIGNNLKTIRLLQGTTNNQISVSKTWANTQYNEAVTVWIDFNRNSTFEVGERILTSPPNKNTPITGTFTVPSDAFVSLTNDKYVVMRVVMQRDGSPLSCVNFPNGEVEDYKVMISKSGTINALDQNTIFIYPNPVSDILNISKVSEGALYTIYNAAGQLISKGKIYGRKINVSKLERGVYVIDIDNNGETAQKKFIKN